MNANGHVTLDGVTYVIESHTRRGMTLLVSRNGTALERITADLADLKERTLVAEVLIPLLGDGVDVWSHLREIAVSRDGSAGQGRENFTSAYMDLPSEVKLTRVNAATLREEALLNDRATLHTLPLLGQKGFFLEGLSNLLASYPKTGKTELMIHCVLEWTQGVLYLTEEPRLIWQARLAGLQGNFSHVELIFALGAEPDDMLSLVRDGDEPTVVMDTVRNLLRLQDEKDNSEVARRLIPYIDAARQAGKTVIFLHHDRKGGGEHGEAIAGGHSFLGVVDVALELRRDPNHDRRRQVRGWGRVIEVPNLVYEKQDDGKMKALGAPAEVALGEVRRRVLEAEILVPETWRTTKEVRDSLGEPRPSDDQVRAALLILTREGLVRRDPPLTEEKTQGRTHQWQLVR